MPDELVNVRYMVDDVENAVAFYTTQFGFTVRTSAAPAFADVVRGNLRLLLSGPTAAPPSQAVGTASTSSSKTSRPRSSGYVPPA
jgi:predicted enzyme related to lactoylglutathione lyase